MRVLNRIIYLPRRRINFNPNGNRNYSIKPQRLPPNKSVFVYFSRPYSESKKSENQIVENTTGEERAVQTTVIENIKETTKTVSYLGIVLVGFSISLSVIYVIFSELFSSKSPNKVYSKAFDYVSKDPRVQNAIGDQIKGFGEESRRGRRQHISHVLYEKDGMKLMRMKFYIKGNRESGTVHLEMFENEKGQYDYRYLFVITDGMVRKSIILEDNRNKATIATHGGSYPELSKELPELDLSLK